jgi:hypothetical protein
MRAHDAADDFAANYLHNVMKAVRFLLSTFHEENKLHRHHKHGMLYLECLKPFAIHIHDR